MAKTNNLHDFLVDLANAIRTKKKYPDSQKINPQDFSDEIDGISGGDNKLAQLLNKTITEVTEEDFGNATSTGDYRFLDCNQLISVSMPNRLQSIGQHAFRNCTKLESITMGNGVINIGIQAFDGCTGIKSVTIPTSVKIINNSAFSGCSKLLNIHITDIAAWCGISGLSYLMQYGRAEKGIYLNGVLLTDLVIPDNATIISGYAFYQNSHITSVTIPDSVQSIEINAFRNCININNVVIGNGVKTFGNYAFSGCNGLINFRIPDSVTNVGSYTFSACSGLVSIELGKEITNIGTQAFGSCSKLVSVTIPDKVVTIDGSAFRYCSSLTSVTFEGTPTSIATTTFGSDGALTDIYVPWAQGAVSGAPWGATNATIHYNWTPPVPGSDYTGTYEGDGSYSMRYFKIYDANDSLISSGDVDWEGTVTVPQGGHIVVSANETYGGISIKVNNLVNCTASAVDSWTETVTITPTADNFSFNCVDDFD